MLEHVACPQCGAPNLRTEVICFACGQPLRKRPRQSEGPPPVPWVFWLGLAFALAAFGLLAMVVSQWLGAYRMAAGVPDFRMFGLAALLAVAGQVSLYRSRRDDAQWWEWKRAPELPLSQVSSGDAVWVRGSVKCDTPLALPYVADGWCIYYRLVVRERDEGESGWRTTQHEVQAVDFTVTQESGAISVPSGVARFEAPLFVDTYLADGVKAQVWALALDVPISVCGRVDGDGDERLLSHLSAGTPVVVTWRPPSDYLAEVGRRGRRALWFGWITSALAALVLIATLARG